MLEDLRSDDCPQRAWNLCQVDRLQRVRVETGFAEQRVPVIDASLVEIDTGHVVPPASERQRDQPPCAAPEFDSPLIWPQVIPQPVEALLVAIDVLSRNDLHHVREKATLMNRKTS